MCVFVVVQTKSLDLLMAQQSIMLKIIPKICGGGGGGDRTNTGLKPHQASHFHLPKWNGNMKVFSLQPFSLVSPENEEMSTCNCFNCCGQRNCGNLFYTFIKLSEMCFAFCRFNVWAWETFPLQQWKHLDVGAASAPSQLVWKSVEVQQLPQMWCGNLKLHWRTFQWNGRRLVSSS